MYELGGQRMKWMIAIMVVTIVIIGGWLGYKAWVRSVPVSNGWHTANEDMRLLLQKQSEVKSEEKVKKPTSAGIDGKSTEANNNTVAGSQHDSIPVAAVTTDEARIKQHPSTPSIPATSETVKEKEKEKGKIQLNKATAAQLITIPGIGESKAKAILAHRKQIGRFQNIEQLLDVKGIGDKLLEKMKPYLAIDS